MSDPLDRGDKNDELRTDVNASFSCTDCGQILSKWRPEFKRTREYHGINLGSFFGFFIEMSDKNFAVWIRESWSWLWSTRLYLHTVGDIPERNRL